jgi:hypothetical protein
MDPGNHFFREINNITGSHTTAAGNIFSEQNIFVHATKRFLPPFVRDHLFMLLLYRGYSNGYSIFHAINALAGFPGQPPCGNSRDEARRRRLCENTMAPPRGRPREVPPHYHGRQRQDDEKYFPGKYK